MFIANMLGVRRESVTEDALRLQRAGLIRYTRGRITVLDRPGLEKCTCECYAVVKQEYDRLPPGSEAREEHHFRSEPADQSQPLKPIWLQRNVGRVW